MGGNRSALWSTIFDWRWVLFVAWKVKGEGLYFELDGYYTDERCCAPMLSIKILDEVRLPGFCSDAVRPRFEYDSPMLHGRLAVLLPTE